MKTFSQTKQEYHHGIIWTAGGMFLFCFIIPVLNWVVILSGFISPGSNIETAKNIMANETLFRLGLTLELIMSCGLVVLGFALYSILKPVNKTLAGIAFSLKLVESGLSAAIVLISFAVLGGENHIIGLILNIHKALYSVPMFFLGLDMTIFCYLFFKSRYIPKALAGLGIVSFIFILFHSIMYFVMPGFASLPVCQAIFYSPSCVFEMIIGIWLLTPQFSKRYAITRG